MSTQFRFKNRVLALALAAAYPAASYAAGAARLEFVSGSVVAITPAGVQRQLSRGSELVSGEAIRTGDNARAQLRFSDGAMMSLQPQTEFRIDEYRYSGKVDGEERGFFSLIKGGLRTITGLVGKGQRDNYHVSTAVATIGIRGTEYSATFTGGSEGTLNTTTNEGAIAVCGLSGSCFTAPSGQSVVVQGVSDPKPNQDKPFMPAPGMPQQGGASGNGSRTGGSGVGDPNAGMGAVSPSNDRTASGSYTALPGTANSNVIGPPLTTDSGYAVGLVEASDGFFFTGSTIATFGDASKLLSTATGDYAAVSVKEAYSLDGAIGWGAWSSGTGEGVPIGSGGVVHYVVGKPTDASAMPTNVTATYSMVGHTAPTSGQGAVGSLVTASLAITFNGGGNTATFGVTYGLNGQHSASASGGFGATNSSFNISGGGLTAQGVLIGNNAAYAGVVYQDFNGQDVVNGAVAFKR